MNWYYARTHVAYIALIAIGCIGLRAYLAEHDQRLLAEYAVKASQQQVASLEAQIKANEQQAEQAREQYQRLRTEVRTPLQVVQELPKVASVPVPPQLDATNNLVFPQADVLPLFSTLADGAQCKVELASAQSNLALESQVIAEKDKQVAALRKKPSFWHRVGSIAKQVGVGIVIGVVASRI